MLLVFFVLKKDRKKRMVQNYRYLNSWTIKNNYLLLLISDLINNIRKKKIFIKIDLRQKYNNMRIKKGDKWKAAFAMIEGVFELMVMLFGLMNLPATFQAIINDLLRNMIEAGDVAAFMDDVMV